MPRSIFITSDLPPISSGVPRIRASSTALPAGACSITSNERPESRNRASIWVFASMGPRGAECGRVSGPG